MRRYFEDSEDGGDTAAGLKKIAASLINARVDESKLLKRLESICREISSVTQSIENKSYRSSLSEALTKVIQVLNVMKLEPEPVGPEARTKLKLVRRTLFKVKNR